MADRMFVTDEPGSITVPLDIVMVPQFDPKDPWAWIQLAIACREKATDLGMEFEEARDAIEHM